MTNTQGCDAASSRPLLILIDEQRRIVGMNHAAEELTGSYEEEVAGRICCHELFGCRETTGTRMNGGCPGLGCFAAGRDQREAAYTITDRHGAQVEVRSSYHFIRGAANGHLAMIHMEPLAARARRLQPAQTRREMVGFALAVCAALVFFLVGRPYPHPSYAWKTIGAVTTITSDEPAAFAFRSGETGAHVVYVSAQRGRPATALEGHCTLDGARVQWSARHRAFVCPNDGSTFGRDGSPRSGPAENGLRPVPLKMHGDTVLAYLPAA